MEIVDLTYSIEEGMLTFPSHWHPFTEITMLGRIGVEGRETRKMILGTHTGTHMDAPLHFINAGRSIDEINLNKVIGNVEIIDLSYLEPGTPITPEILSAFDLNEKLIFRFGWGKYWGSMSFYSRYPYFTKEAAEYLIENKVHFIGMDTPSPDDSRVSLTRETWGTPQDSPIHKLLLSNEVVIVEYIANLDLLQELRGWSVIALPLKIKGGDGCPIRICLIKN